MVDICVMFVCVLLAICVMLLWVAVDICVMFVSVLDDICVIPAVDAVVAACVPVVTELEIPVIEPCAIASARVMPEVTRSLKP